jgi:uncharacterized membrane protein
MLEGALPPPLEIMADLNSDPPTGAPPPTPLDQSLWGVPTPGESRWPATVAVLAALVIQAILPERLTIGPSWIIPSLELCLLIPLVIANPSRLSRESRDVRKLSIALIALVSAANIVSLGLLVRVLVNGTKVNGKLLIVAAVGIWITQVLVFGLWYWETDRGGPIARTRADHAPPDFLFPQMENPGVHRGDWYPTLYDYVYVSLTNSTAFSPTDTMPLTTRAKALLASQSLVSLTTIAVVGARAVNILS